VQADQFKAPMDFRLMVRVRHRNAWHDRNWNGVHQDLLYLGGIGKGVLEGFQFGLNLEAGRDGSPDQGWYLDHISQDNGFLGFFTAF
jgi:hypothetical protein